MVVKEMPSEKKAKKRKHVKGDSDDTQTQNSKSSPDTTNNEDTSILHTDTVKKHKKKKRHTSDSGDVPDVDVAPPPGSVVPKSGKKRKREETDTSAGASPEQSDPPKASTNKKAKKHKKAHSEGIESVDASNENEEATKIEPSVASDKKPRSKKGENPVKPKDPKLEQRTVFVGNLPIKTNRRDLSNFFLKYGKVESVRLRSAPRLDAKKPIRMAVITHRFSEDRSSINGYVRFTSEAAAEKAAAEANGTLFEEHHLRVNMSLAESRPDPRLAAFVGGLPLNAEDNQLWAHFAECGTIASVRIVRDRETSVGKGFGYVNFGDEEAVLRALKLNGSELEGRAIRVQRCHATARPKVDRFTGKKLRKPRAEGDKPAEKAQDNRLAPVNKFSGDATAESKSSLKKKKGQKKKERRPDGRSLKRSLAQSLSKTIAPAAKPLAPVGKSVAVPVISVGGVTPQNKKIKFDFGDDDAATDGKKNDSEKLKEIKMKKEAKRKKKAKENEAKKKTDIVEPLTNILPS